MRQRLLPRPCPSPKVCQTRFHWTAVARERWEIRQEDARAERAEQALTLTRSSDPFEEGRHRIRDRKRTEAVAMHQPSLSHDPAERTIVRNGERQLQALAGEHLSTIGLLTCADIYSVNRVLRRGGDLTGGAPAMMDWAGYASKQEFVDDAYDVLAALGDAIEFDEPVRLFRGIGLPSAPDEYRPDIAGLARHFRTGQPWESEYIDPGFSFASPDPRNAALYRGQEAANDPSAEIPVLLELDAFQGICIPDAEHRSTELFGHTFGIDFLHGAMCQVIFPPNTRWKITSVELHSEHGQSIVHMRQI
jgi:hypothetical protein